MSTTDYFCDVEGAMKTFLINHPDMATSSIYSALLPWWTAPVPSKVGIFFGVSKKAAYPLVTIELAGGSTGRYSPTDSPRLTISSWAQSKDEALAVIRRVRAILWSLDNQLLDEDTFCFNVEVGNLLWLPDDSDSQNKLARYIVDAIVTVRAV